MQKTNIADFILYDLAQTKINNDFGINSGIISDVVEGWNNNVYVVPNKTIKFARKKTKNFRLM